MLIKNGYVWNGRIFEKKDLYVENGKFVNFTDSGPVVDATGLFVMPGWVDSHAHVIGTGMKLLTHDLTKETLSDILSKTQENFVIARGWEELPDVGLLNKANLLKKPVILIRKCGHVAWVNDHLKDSIGKKENLLYEDEIEKVWSIFGDEFFKKAFEVGQNEFIRYGVTQVHSDDFHGESFETLKELLRNSKIRIFEKLYTKEPWKYEFGVYGISKIGAIKQFADGSLGGKTAYMLKPYKNSTNFGTFTLPKNFDDIVRFAEQNNIQINVHTIGDKALREVLNRFEKNKVHLRHRLIHLQFISKEDFPKLNRYYLSVQPHFYFEDIPLLESVSFEMAYPFLEMHKAGYNMAFSTDSPVSPADPKYVLEKALKMGFTKEDTIYYYTEAGSKIAGYLCGKIDVGYYADFVLYQDDPFENDPVAVFVNGKEVTSR
ncbi:amidohydrolase [Fervidobacterium sp.]